MALVATLTGGAAGALCEEPLDPRDVTIGTFTIGEQGFAVGEPAPGTPTADNERESGAAGPESSHWFMQRFEAGLQESAEARQSVLEDAEQQLKRGYVSAAQRLFERLIAEAPDTPEARMARGHLAELYQGGWERVPAKTRAREQLVRVAKAIDDQFVSQVGDRVFFSARSAELGSRALAVLQAQARFLRRMPELSAVIEGHADDGLSEEESEQLSEARAAAVRDRLVAEGVDTDRITMTSKGRSERIAACAEAECQAQNRRAITVLMSGSRGGVRSARSSGASEPLAGGPATQ